MNSAPGSDSQSAAAGAFPATLWTVVHQARSGDTATATDALDRLCERYERAIHAWFRRSRPGWIPEARAEEWAQDFLVFMHEKNPFRHLEQRDARFRSFLVTCLKNFQRDRIAAEMALKRGGGVAHVELQEATASSPAADLAAVLDQEFALDLHGRVLDRIREECERKGHRERYDVLAPHLLGLQPDVSHEVLAARLGLVANHVRKIVFDLRERYYDYFRDEVGQVVRDAQTLDEEMRYLAGLVARGARRPL